MFSWNEFSLGMHDPKRRKTEKGYKFYLEKDKNIIFTSPYIDFMCLCMNTSYI